jgi:hypothetical protein
MPTLKKRVNFFDSEEGIRIKQVLVHMAKDSKYNTDSSYSANSMQYSDNLIPFVDKHVNYLNAHPNLDPQHYLANLRLITRIR